MGCLLRTAWSDPGIIPRAKPEEAAYIEKLMQGEFRKINPVLSYTKTYTFVTFLQVFNI